MAHAEFIDKVYAELRDTLFDPEDLRIDVFRDNDGMATAAVRVTHRPTGRQVVVEERSTQMENATLALIRTAAVLRSDKTRSTSTSPD